jgi:hypothetical protein
MLKKGGGDNSKFNKLTKLRKMRKNSYLWIAVALTSGCATILSGRTQIVTIESDPPGARCDLTREGRIIGVVKLVDFQTF